MSVGMTAEDPQSGRRFTLLRGLRRGLKAACRWTIAASIGLGRKTTSRVRRRRGLPPLASLSAVMLQPEDMMDMGGDVSFAPFKRQQQPLLMGQVDLLSSAGAISDGSFFPLVLRPPSSPLAVHEAATTRQCGDSGVQRSSVDTVSMGGWLRHHQRRSTGCCDGSGASASPSQDEPHQHQDPSQSHDLQQRSHSLQHLLAVGSRQWGGVLRVKIYDFAIYADQAKAAESFSSGLAERRLAPLPGCSTGGLTTTMAPAGPGGGVSGGGGSGGGVSGGLGGAAELLVPAASGVDVSLTIRACRNLPLPLLAQEFERILQRRVAKAGGSPDDPALRELLSYFSRQRLPRHVVTPPSPGAGPDGDAVRKGASITFSRRSGGELVTEAGGRVLGAVVAPALAEALFDLYLGDQPVSKRAKAAAGDALLRLAGSGSAHAGGEAGGSLPRYPGRPQHAPSVPSRPQPRGYLYRLQPGERLHCPPGAGPGQPEACLLELP